MIHAGTGYSGSRNPKEAAREAVEKAVAACGGAPDLVVCFATVGYPQETLISEIRKLTNDAPLTGCSAEGVISQAGSVEGSFGVVVGVLRSDTVRFQTASATGLKEDSRAAGRTLAESLGEQSDALSLMVFPDGLTVNFDAMLAGFEDVRSAYLPVFGGTSADDWALEATYQYCDDQVMTDGVSAVLWTGQAESAVAVTHGCVPLGKELKVTRAEANMIYEIDGRPALDVLYEFLEEDELADWNQAVAHLTIGFPTPSEKEGLDDFIVRYIPVRDEVNRSIGIPTEVETGCSVWIQRRDEEKIRAGLATVSSTIEQQLDGEPGIVFQFDCAGRGQTIFREAHKQSMLEELRASVGNDVPWLGFHSYGEIGPIAGANHFHNYTAVIVAMR